MKTVLILAVALAAFVVGVVTGPSAVATPGAACYISGPPFVNPGGQPGQCGRCESCNGFGGQHGICIHVYGCP